MSLGKLTQGRLGGSYCNTTTCTHHYPFCVEGPWVYSLRAVGTHPSMKASSHMWHGPHPCHWIWEWTLPLSSSNPQFIFPPWGGVLLCSPDWPQTGPLTSAFLTLWFQVCTTTPSLKNVIYWCSDLACNENFKFGSIFITGGIKIQGQNSRTNLGLVSGMFSSS